ncbi:MAG: RNA polymerase sigma factor [Muricomes sp.]
MDDMTNKKIFERLYDAYAGSVYRIAYSILHDEGQAEDAVHDTFVKLMPYLHTLTDINGNRTKMYLSVAVKNTAINQYRKNKRENENCVVGLSEDMRGLNISTMPAIISAENRTVLKQLLKKLDNKQREIIELHCFYGLSYKEIAGILNISEAAAGKRFERARAEILSLTNGKEDVF